MRKQLFLSLAVIVLCITIPISCDSSSSNQASNGEADTIRCYAKLTGNNVNLRADANTTSEVKCKPLSKGEIVGVIDTVKGWSKINYNDTIGFVLSQYLDTIKNTVKENAATEDGGQEEVNDTTKTEEKEEVETETTDKDTTSIADAEKEDSVQAEPEQPADTLQAFTVNTALVDSLWEQMLMKR